MQGYVDDLIKQGEKHSFVPINNSLTLQCSESLLSKFE
jgi:hypothetical protein